LTKTVREKTLLQRVQ